VWSIGEDGKIHMDIAKDHSIKRYVHLYVQSQAVRYDVVNTYFIFFLYGIITHTHTCTHRMSLHLDVIDRVELVDNRGRTELRVCVKDSDTVLRFRERFNNSRNQETTSTIHLSDWFRDIRKQKNALETARGLEPEILKHAQQFIAKSNQTFPTYKVLKQFIVTTYDELTFSVHRLKLSNMLKTHVKSNGGNISPTKKKKDRSSIIRRRLSENILNAVAKSTVRRCSPPRIRTSVKTPISPVISSPSLHKNNNNNMTTPKRRRSPIVTPQELLRAGYRLTDKIGKGSFAFVFKACQLSADSNRRAEVVAVKLVDKEKQNAKRRRKEIETLRVVHQHRNFVTVYDTIESERYLFIVTEYVAGGELFDFIIRRGRFSEDDCRVVARQLLEAVAYMHAVGIVHRDLKPENLLLGTPDNIQDIRICDFGQATFLRPWIEVESMNSEFASRKSLANTLGGTLAYLAPEVLLSDHAHAFPVDIWSVGVILFVLLGARHPFPDTSPLNYIKSIDKFASMTTERDRIEFLFRGGDDSSIFDDISPSALSLILSMLKPEPMIRTSASAALKSSWFDITPKNEDKKKGDKEDVVSLLQRMNIRGEEEEEEEEKNVSTPVRSSRRRPRSVNASSPFARRNTWASPSKQTLVEPFGMSQSERVSSGGASRRRSDEQTNRRRSVRLKDYRSSVQRQRKRARRGVFKMM